MPYPGYGLQNGSNHGCDGCAVSFDGKQITIFVADAKSSKNGVNNAASAKGDPKERLAGWLETEWAKTGENKAFRDALYEALIVKQVPVKGITVKVGVPAPGSSGKVQYRVEKWTK